MGRGLTSREVAVWLRLQIAAGRLPRDANLDDIQRLARRLGVSEETLSDAFVQLESDMDQDWSRHSNGGANGYRTVADLIDEIASCERRAG